MRPVSTCAGTRAKSREDDAVKLRLEPLHPILLLQQVAGGNPALPDAALRNATARAGEEDEEVHTVDARAGVVLEPEVDVLRDSEAEAALVREVPLAELVLLHLQPPLKNLLSLLAAHGHVARDLLVAPDAEGPDRLGGLREHRLLLCQLLKHLRGTRETIAALAHADVEHQLLDADAAHGVVRLVRSLDHGALVCPSCPETDPTKALFNF